MHIHGSRENEIYNTEGLVQEKQSKLNDKFFNVLTGNKFATLVDEEYYPKRKRKRKFQNVRPQYSFIFFIVSPLKTFWISWDNIQQ